MISHSVTHHCTALLITHYFLTHLALALTLSVCLVMCVFVGEKNLPSKLIFTFKGLYNNNVIILGQFQVPLPSPCYHDIFLHNDDVIYIQNNRENV